MARSKLDPSNVGIGLSLEEISRLRNNHSEFESNVKVEFEPNLPQFKVLTSLASEIFIAGSKYGGKTVAGRYWMISGNPTEPNFDSEGNPILVNISYSFHPEFIGVVIRKTEKDLREWILKSENVYKIYGWQYYSNPSEFRHESGARIFLGHGEDKNSWESWQGVQVIRFLIEEAGQIPHFEVFDNLRSSCRAGTTGLRAQMLLTANPGGPGQIWLYDRFIEPKDKEGNLLINPQTNLPYQPEEIIEEEIVHPYTGEKKVLTRQWIPSYLHDNKYALEDEQYVLQLASMQDEKTRKAYLFGDWKAFTGTYFDNFSPAIHCVKSESLLIEPWWPTWFSLDIGYSHESAVYGFKRNPDTKQIICFKEFVAAGIEPVELGTEIGYLMSDDLRIHGTIPLYISHDAYYKKTGEITQALMLQQGLSKVLGWESVHLPSLYLKELEERALRNGEVWTPEDEHKFRIQIYKKAAEMKGAVLYSAPRDRVSGWTYVRSKFRTKPLFERNPQTFSPDVAREIARKGNIEAYITYIKTFAKEADEILPLILILRDQCPRLIDAIPRAIHDELNPEDITKKHFRGADSLDSFRYGLMGERDQLHKPPPESISRSRELARIISLHPNLTVSALVRLNLTLDESLNPSASSVRPRLSMRRRT